MFARAAALSRTCRYLLRAHGLVTNSIHRPSFPSFQSRSFAAANAAMASATNTSGVTADSLKETLTKQLQAQHVEIEDMSGMR